MQTDVQTFHKVVSERLPESKRGAAMGFLKDVMLAGGIDELLWTVDVYRKVPVSFRDFVTNPFYLGRAEEVYPVVLEELCELNRLDAPYSEAVFTGGIGSGKTTAAHYTTAYRLYVLSCMKKPHRYFSLDPASEILIVLQSLTAAHAKQVEYNRFRSLLSGSPYFTDVWAFDRDIESKMVFPNRIEVVPVAGHETAVIGQNVIGGVLDEVNYMSIVERSKASVDGGTYDQAWSLYNSIVRRRKSRFIKDGRVYGMLCLVSSKRFPGQFTDVKEQERDKQLQETGTTDIYIYDKRAWEVKPGGAYSGDMFKLFIGDDARKPRVLEDYEVLKESDLPLVMEVPVEYKGEFERDIVNALREIAGVSTLARHPYILDTESVADCSTAAKKSLFSEEMTDFDAYPVKVRPKLATNPTYPRWVHIDLSQTGDSTGIVIGHVAKFIRVDRGDTVEIWPQIVIDGALEVRPPKNGEVLYYKIRKMLYLLRDRGVNLKWVSFDSYQSVDSMQVLRREGFITGLKSMDTDVRPYAFAKGALYDRRIVMPEHRLLRRELLSIEYDPKKNKVDHPSTGSKDVADAFAGVVHGLTTRRELWVAHKVPLQKMPALVSRAVVDKDPEAK